MGIDMDKLEETVLAETDDRVHTDRFLAEEYTHGLLIDFGGGEGGHEYFLSRGIQPVEADPEELPGQGSIVKHGHIVHAVEDLDEAVRTYERLFRWRPSNRWEFDDAGLRSAFFRIIGQSIQLVEPTTPDGIVAETMEEIGEGVAYAVLMTDSLDAFVDSMKARGIETPRSTVGEKPVAWIPRDLTGGMAYQIVEPHDYYSYFKTGTVR